MPQSKKWEIKSVKDIADFFSANVKPADTRKFWENTEKCWSIVEKLSAKDLGPIASSAPSTTKNLYTVMANKLGLSEGITTRKDLETAFKQKYEGVDLGKKPRTSSLLGWHGENIDVHGELVGVSKEDEKFIRRLIYTNLCPPKTDYEGITEILKEYFPAEKNRTPKSPRKSPKIELKEKKAQTPPKTLEELRRLNYGADDIDPEAEEEMKTQMRASGQMKPKTDTSKKVAVNKPLPDREEVKKQLALAALLSYTYGDKFGYTVNSWGEFLIGTRTDKVASFKKEHEKEIAEIEAGNIPAKYEFPMEDESKKREKREKLYSSLGVKVTKTNEEDLVQLLFESIPIESTKDFTSFVTKSLDDEVRESLFYAEYERIISGLNNNELAQIAPKLADPTHNLYTSVATALNFDDTAKKKQRTDLLADKINTKNELTGLLNMIASLPKDVLQKRLQGSDDLDFKDIYQHPIQLAYRLAPEANKYKSGTGLPKHPTPAQLNRPSDPEKLKEAVGLLFLRYNSDMDDIEFFIDYFGEHNFMKKFFEDKYYEITEMLSDRDLKRLAEKLEKFGPNSPNLYFLTAKKLEEDMQHGLRIEDSPSQITTREKLNDAFFLDSLMRANDPNESYRKTRCKDTENNAWKVMERLLHN